MSACSFSFTEICEVKGKGLPEAQEAPGWVFMAVPARISQPTLMGSAHPGGQWRWQLLDRAHVFGITFPLHFPWCPWEVWTRTMDDHLAHCWLVWAPFSQWCFLSYWRPLGIYRFALSIFLELDPHITMLANILQWLGTLWVLNLLKIHFLLLSSFFFLVLENKVEI